MADSMEAHIPTPDGLSLWTETFGDPARPTLLLVMGAMNQGVVWPDAWCQRLAEAGYHVIRYDHRDTGCSSKVGRWRPYTLRALTRDAVAVLHGLGVQRATVVGLSMGGFIGQLMALDHPECVERLVLISTSADHRPYLASLVGWPAQWLRLPPPEGAYLAHLRAVRRSPPRNAEECLANVRRAWATLYAGPRGYPQDAVEAMLQRTHARTDQPLAAMNHGLAIATSRHRLDRVQQIRVPTLVIHGRHDPLFPLAHGEYLAQHIPGAQLRVLDMGHVFMSAWDDEVFEAVVDFADAG